MHKTDRERIKLKQSPMKKTMNVKFFYENEQFFLDIYQNIRSMGR